MMQKLSFLVITTCITIQTSDTTDYKKNNINYKKKYIECLRKLLLLDIENRRTEDHWSINISRDYTTLQYVEQWQNNQTIIEKISTMISTFQLTRSDLDIIFGPNESVTKYAETNTNILQTLNNISHVLQEKNAQLESFLNNAL